MLANGERGELKISGVGKGPGLDIKPNSSVELALANGSKASFAAVQPQADALPAPASPLRVGQTNLVSTVGTPASNDVPALQAALDLPMLVLSALIFLVLYLVYYQVRVLRAGQAQANCLNRRMNAKESRLFILPQQDAGLQGLPKHKDNPCLFELTADKVAQAQAVESRQSSLPEPRPNFAADSSLKSQDAVDDDEVTSVPWLNLHDDDATFRLAQAIKQPIIGYFVRATSDPSLPSELPIYGLGPLPGELGQVHIGRHSKNNTVVINNKNISREHAIMLQKEGRLYLRDNASTAGTYLNWRQLKPGEELLLRNNDIVSFGEIIYKFHAKSEDEAAFSGGRVA